jgi:hypothetical protein
MQVGAASGGGLVELASGVDALYLSGWAALSPLLCEQLHDKQLAARAAGEPQPFKFGGTEFKIWPHGFGRFPYRLEHRHGVLQLNPNSNLPPIRIQPRAEFLHGVGALGAARWFEDVIVDRCGFTELSVSRVDLHADFLGWQLSGEDRERFVCRARARTTYEDDGRWTGFSFGMRKTGTFTARIYDKTEELKRSKAGYWEDIWGSSYKRGEQVVRVEFELARKALREFQLSSPDEVVTAAGSLWLHMTTNWLSYRSPSGDATKARWPVAPEWDGVRRARLADEAHGLARMVEGRRRATVLGLTPGLVGYLASYAAAMGTEGIADTCDLVPELLERYEKHSERQFADRVAEKVKKARL